MTYKYWTDKEIDYLRKHYGKITVTEIMRTIPRSRKSIEKKAVKLGLKSKTKGGTNYANPHNRGQGGLSGEDHHAYRQPGKPWISNGRTYFKRDKESPVESYPRYLMEQQGHDLSGKIVTHKDGDPTNCDLDNLMVCTRAQNMVRNIHRCKDPELRRARQRMGQTGESLFDLILKGEFV